MRVADFFCGGGGFSEGFRQAGFKIVFAVDKWLPAVTTYKGNKPGVNVIQDDVIRISKLPDDEFEKLVPDSEVIIGSPPCQSFSNSNKSGNNDKTLGIQLVEAYLRIIARKKYKKDSCLKYWVLENVPNVKHFIHERYTAQELGLEGDFVFETRCKASGVYNAKYFGAPTNRERYLCGDFPEPVKTNNDSDLVTLGQVLRKLGKPKSTYPKPITDINYPDFSMSRRKVTDHHYVFEIAPHEWEVAKRLKQDRGYMGVMSFPENLNKPSRTVMANVSMSSRESMILGMGDNRYRAPTIREVASMMSFPIDYRFYGESIGIKHTLVGNAVPPKMSYAIAKAIALDAGETVPDHYIPIVHAKDVPFVNLNKHTFHIREELPKRDVSRFKYHIPYLIVNRFRTELTNYNSDFENKLFKWDVEIHYSQGKVNARVYKPVLSDSLFPNQLVKDMKAFAEEWYNRGKYSFNDFQRVFCMPTKQRQQDEENGPFELLNEVKAFIVENVKKEEKSIELEVDGADKKIPYEIAVGYYLLDGITKKMGGFCLK